MGFGRVFRDFVAFYDSEVLFTVGVNPTRNNLVFLCVPLLRKFDQFVKDRFWDQISEIDAHCGLHAYECGVKNNFYLF
ncbi:MAG: hypothetical protein ACTSYU_06300, partial [Promethearchaeota archaeon]